MSYTEETAQMLFAALRCSSVAVMDEAMRISRRELALGRITPREHLVVMQRLEALGWKKP